MADCYFFAALPCEAKPLIKHFKLKKELSVTAFTIYRNANITLTVTGLGKSAMAAGVAYTLALFPALGLPVLLNIGIAGHCSHELGSIFAVEKITDQETGRKHYPQWVISPPCPTQSLITVAQAEPSYASDAMYEMEASAFYETATRFSSSELIHCIKVISDNKDSPSAQIKPAQVSQWLMNALPIIEKISQKLGELAGISPLSNIDSYAEIIAQWHFTNSEKIQLKSLLNKRAILINNKSLDLMEMPQTTAKEFLNSLRQELDEQAFGGF
ncbi:MAG: hypothetical protein GQ583_08120 [Methyloprofundus sp.]|nr:hypothetical protein [Methyloprofundus sp.]